MITVVDYGMGNLGSAVNMFRRYQIPYRTSTDPREIEKADKLLLPGVGAFDAGVRQLQRSGIWTALQLAVQEREARFLGICLGMQLLAKGSEEGNLEGLGWIDTVAQRFRFAPGQKDGRFPLRVPHMSWRTVHKTRDSVLLNGITEPRFYFVHSYYIPARLPITTAEANHHTPFSAVLEADNLFGVQFHPEKSHGYGVRLFQNFCRV